MLDLEAISNDMTYPRMRIWISQDGLVRKTEDSSLSGQLLRTSLFTDYWRIGNRFVPRQVVFIETLRGAIINGRFVNETTQINVNNPSFNRLADATFSKAFLERFSR